MIIMIDMAHFVYLRYTSYPRKCAAGDVLYSDQTEEDWDELRRSGKARTKS
jgi:hypothetical protein